MQIVIKIPESFEGHFNQDRFKDSLERILKDCRHSAILSGIYEFETIEMLIMAFKNGAPLPKGHGRLIYEPTKEEIEKTVGGQNDFAECIRDSVKAVFDNAPTIIEADGGGGNDDND